MIGLELCSIDAELSKDTIVGTRLTQDVVICIHLFPTDRFERL